MKKLKLKRTVKKNLIKATIAIYFAYSFIGVAVMPAYQKDNGNIFKGFDYGLKACTGNINAE